MNAELKESIGDVVDEAKADLQAVYGNIITRIINDRIHNRSVTVAIELQSGALNESKDTNVSMNFEDTDELVEEDYGRHLDDVDDDRYAEFFGAIGDCSDEPADECNKKSVNADVEELDSVHDDDDESTTKPVASPIENDADMSAHPPAPAHCPNDVLFDVEPADEYEDDVTGDVEDRTISSNNRLSTADIGIPTEIANTGEAVTLMEVDANED